MTPTMTHRHWVPTVVTSRASGTIRVRITPWDPVIVLRRNPDPDTTGRQ